MASSLPSRSRGHRTAKLRGTEGPSGGSPRNQKQGLSLRKLTFPKAVATEASGTAWWWVCGAGSSQSSWLPPWKAGLGRKGDREVSGDSAVMTTVYPHHARCSWDKKKKNPVSGALLGRRAHATLPPAASAQSTGSRQRGCR